MTEAVGSKMNTFCMLLGWENLAGQRENDLAEGYFESRVYLIRHLQSKELVLRPLRSSTFKDDEDKLAELVC